MIDRTNLDIRHTEELEEGRHHPKRRRSFLLNRIDGLLWELEELNLQGRDRVPARVRRESVAIFNCVQGGQGLEARFRVQAMMDVLYRAQELVLREIDPDYRGEEDETEGEDQPA